ncbi:hypothetical protein VPH35_097461 [Triticum aestivum]
MTPSLRSSISSDQIRRARPPAAMHDPPRRLGFRPPRHRRGSDVAPVTQIQHAAVACAPDAMDGKAATSPAPTPWRTQLHHCPDAIQENLMDAA